MQVIDHEPQTWFLLQDADGYLLDVDCSRSTTGFSVLLRLNAEETAAIDADRRAASSAMAERVRDRPNDYFPRAADQALEAAALAAVLAWRQGGSDTTS